MDRVAQNVITERRRSVHVKKARSKFQKSNSKHSGLIIEQDRRHFISKPERRIIYAEICDVFKTWRSWQRRTLLCGFSEKCSKPLLYILSTALEPALHKAYSSLRYLCVGHTGFQTKCHKPSNVSALTDCQFSNADQNESQISHPCDGSFIKKSSLTSSQISETRLTALRTEGSVGAVSQHSLKERGLCCDKIKSPFNSKAISEYNKRQEKSIGSVPYITRTKVESDKFICSNNLGVKYDSPGSHFDSHCGHRFGEMLHLPLITPNEETTSLPPIKTKLKENYSNSNPNITLSRTEQHEHISPASANSINALNFFSDSQVQKISKLGHFYSDGTLVQKVQATKCFTSNAFKHKKWWLPPIAQDQLTKPSGKKLFESFKSKSDSIWKLFDEWSNAEKGDCLLEILSLCDPEEISFFGECVIQRLREKTSIERLPGGVMLKIFQELEVKDLGRVAQVCKQWHILSADGDLWKKRCDELGRKYNMPDVVSKVEESANGMQVDWKFAYKDLLTMLNNLKEQLPNDAYGPEPADLNANDREYVEYLTADLEERLTLLGSLDYPDSEPEDQVVPDDTLALGEDEDGSSQLEHDMNPYLGGNLSMIEEQLQLLSGKREDGGEDDDLALDIRPDLIQAENKITKSTQDEKYKEKFTFVLADDIRTLKRVRKLHGHLEAVLSLQFDSKRVMTGSADRTVRIWDVRSGRNIHKLRAHKGGIRSIRFDDKYIMTASWDMTIMVWDVVKFKLLEVLYGHQGCVSCLDMNQEILVSGSHDMTLMVWSKTNWHCQQVLEGHQGAVTCLVVLEEGKVLSGSADRTLRLWDLATFCCEQKFYGHQDVILTVQVCGELVLSGSADGMVIFWNLNTGKCEGGIQAHHGAVYSLAFIGARFVTAGGDQLLKEWDLSTCTCMRSLSGHKGAVLCVQASSRRIISGSADGTTRVWDMDNRLQQLVGTKMLAVALLLQFLLLLQVDTLQQKRVGGPYDELNENMINARTLDQEEVVEVYDQKQQTYQFERILGQL